MHMYGRAQQHGPDLTNYYNKSYSIYNISAQMSVYLFGSAPGRGWGLGVAWKIGDRVHLWGNKKLGEQLKKEGEFLSRMRLL